MEHVLLHTKLGDITGISLENADFFRNVPFAHAERFEHPHLIEHWEEEIDATVTDISCPQYGTYLDESQKPQPFFFNEFRRGAQFRYAENPLTMNIIRPKNARKCPVLVFIHGGGFETGTVGELPYGSSTMYAERGIILISLGHRLNVFSLYRSENYGLYDMAAGIRWIRRHIADFGGDPDMITVMGQSAGAMSIMDLMYSDLLKGSVKGAVMMSGCGAIPQVLGPLTPEESSAFWDRVEAGCGVSGREALKKVDAEKLWRVWYEASRSPYSFRLMQPGIDGTIISDAPEKLFRKKKVLDIPVIFGVTSQDFMPLFMLEAGYRFANWSRKNYRMPVYGYFFDRVLPGGSFRSFHSSDLWYMFGNMDRSWRPFEEKDYQLSAQMADYIESFVKTQNPNRAGLPQWLPICSQNKNLRLFNGESGGMISHRDSFRKIVQVMRSEKGPM